MPAPAAPSLRALLHHVNANPVGEYAPGELLVVGDYELKARRPEWNLIRVEGTGAYHQIVDAAGNTLYPAAVFDVPTLDGYRVDRSEWADEAADEPHVAGG